MKKVITAIIAISLIVSMTGCSGNQGKDTAQTASPTATAVQKIKYQATYTQKTVGSIKLDIPSEWESTQNGASEYSFRADNQSVCTIKIIDSTSGITDDFKNQFLKEFESLNDFVQASGVTANGVPYVNASGKGADQSSVKAYLLTDGKSMYTIRMQESQDSSYDYSDTIKHIVDSVSIVDMPSASAKSGSTSASTDTKGKMTLSIYNQIKEGMTYEEVVKLIGQEPASESQAELMGQSAKICSWYGTGGIGDNAAIEFQNGKVSSKTQVGLK
jgi:hypothetical protein